MWRIDHVFVRREYRRRGVCRRMVQAACEYADEADAVLYLSTSAVPNVRVYKALGFRVVGAAPSDSEGYLDAASAEARVDQLLLEEEGGRGAALLTTGMARAARRGSDDPPHEGLPAVPSIRASCGQRSEQASSSSKNFDLGSRKSAVVLAGMAVVVAVLVRGVRC